MKKETVSADENARVAKHAEEIAESAKQVSEVLFWAGVAVGAVALVATLVAGAPFAVLGTLALSFAVKGAVIGGAIGVVSGAILGYKDGGWQGAVQGAALGLLFGALMGAAGGVAAGFYGEALLLSSFLAFGIGACFDAIALFYQPTLRRGLVLISDLVVLGGGILSEKIINGSAGRSRQKDSEIHPNKSKREDSGSSQLRLKNLLERYPDLKPLELQRASQLEIENYLILAAGEKVRSKYKINGEHCDTVAQERIQGKYLLVEVKDSKGKGGADVGKALKQFENTLNHVKMKDPTMKIEGFELILPKEGKGKLDDPRYKVFDDVLHERTLNEPWRPVLIANSPIKVKLIDSLPRAEGFGHTPEKNLSTAQFANMSFPINMNHSPDEQRPEVDSEEDSPLPKFD